MGLFDFFRFFARNVPPDELLTSRWTPISDGTFTDIARDYDPYKLAWRVGVGAFESWFQGLEQRLGQSLGRRLAHAAVEYEEHMMSFAGYALPSGRDSSTWSGTGQDWQTRGLGRYELLDDGEETRILVDRPASGPICSGLIAAAWEKATGKRHRFVWSQTSKEALVVTLTPDNSQPPVPKPRRQDWRDEEFPAPMGELVEEMWTDLRVDSSGDWSIMNERRMFLHRDLILRFEDYCLPYLEGIQQGRDDYSWSNSDPQREIWWTAAADSMRESFIESNHHIFISKPEDWIQVARRHLSQHGLGALLSATSLDANGGIELKFRTAFHPALSGGVLLGCWERAYGRNGRLECDFSAQAVALRIRPSRAIAD